MRPPLASRRCSSCIQTYNANQIHDYELFGFATPSNYQSRPAKSLKFTSKLFQPSDQNIRSGIGRKQELPMRDFERDLDFRFITGQINQNMNLSVVRFP